MFGWRPYKRLVAVVEANTEVIAHLDVTLDRLDRRLAVNSEALERNRELHAKVMAAIDDMRDEIRANTAATWRMLDKWGDSPPQPA